jgi:hypothetical protein
MIVLVITDENGDEVKRIPGQSECMLWLMKNDEWLRSKNWTVEWTRED